MVGVLRVSKVSWHDNTDKVKKQAYLLNKKQKQKQRPDRDTNFPFVTIMSDVARKNK